MTIADHIKDNVLEPRLREKQVVVLYDGSGMYRDIAFATASKEIRLIDAAESIVEAREVAMKSVAELGASPDKKPNVLIYVPTSPPADEDARCADFFSALAETGDSFPRGSGDDYLQLCLSAKPDFATRIRELFVEGDPTFDAVDAIGAVGGSFPRLKTELGCESNAEILATLMALEDGQEKHLKLGGPCRKESLEFLGGVIGFTPKTAKASWSIIQGELWRFVLFSEFVFDLPQALPDSLSQVPTAPEGTVDLVNRVCANLRDGARTRQTYIEESERVSEELELEAEMAGFRDLGLRDTFSFEERSFLSGYIDAVLEGDYPKAESIAAERKESVWVQESNRQLLWTMSERALALLRGIADFDRELDAAKKDTGELISFYTSLGYRLDQRYRYFEETLTEIDEDSEDIENLVNDCRDQYRKGIDRLQQLFIAAVKKSGWPVQGVTSAGSLFDQQVKPLLADKDAKVAVLWVDALRYELAVALNESLSASNKTSLKTVCGAIPSITTVGMASLLPDAGELKLCDKGGKLTPFLGGKAIETAQDRVSILAGEYGDRFSDVPFNDLVSKRLTKAYRDKFANKDLVLVRYYRIDSDGEKYGPDLFTSIKRHTDKLLKVVRQLAELGYTDIFLHTDHGFLVFPEHDHGNKAGKPDQSWLLEKERVLAGSAGDHPDTVRFASSDLGVAGDAEHFVFPKTLATFTEGVLYYHGGLSIQECLIPALHIQSKKPVDESGQSWELRISYRGKSSGMVTTRRPMIEIAAFSEDMFKCDITFDLIALDESGETIGSAASSAYTDKNTGYITLEKGTAKIPLKLADEFNGKFEVRAQDPETNKYHGDPIKLETQILE